MDEKKLTSKQFLLDHLFKANYLKDKQSAMNSISDTQADMLLEFINKALGKDWEKHNHINKLSHANFDRYKYEAYVVICCFCGKDIWLGLRVDDSAFKEFPQFKYRRDIFDGRYEFYCLECSNVCGCSENKQINKLDVWYCRLCSKNYCTVHQGPAGGMKNDICKICMETFNFGKSFMDLVLQKEELSIETIIRSLRNTFKKNFYAEKRKLTKQYRSK